MNQCVSLGAQGGDAEGHGDAMIAGGVDSCAVERLAAGHVEAVFEFGDFCAHGAEVFGDERDAVGFFDAQFAGVANADAAAGVRRNGREHRQLIDELGGDRAADLCRSHALLRSRNAHGADKLGVLLLDMKNGDFCAECGEHVEQGGAGWIEAKRIEDEVGAGKERCGTQEKCSGRQIAGNGSLDGVERLRTRDGDGATVARDRCAEGAQGKLAVIAGAHGFADGCGSLGLQAGEQNAGLHLRAGNRSGVVDGRQFPAFDGERRVAISKREACSHPLQRLANALHGPARKRCVADKRKAAALRRKQAGDHAHG